MTARAKTMPVRARKHQAVRPKKQLLLGRWLAPSRVFVALMLTLGTAMAFVAGPFQAPDEPNHFYRSYQVSEGQLLPSWRLGLGGGELPLSVVQVSKMFLNAQFESSSISAQQLSYAAAVPLRPYVLQYVDFSNTASYSPVAYLPQATGILLGRIFDANPLTLMYLGRLTNLLAWTILGYVALRTAPVLARPFFLLMAMPMSLCVAASLSADATTDMLALLLAAIVCRAIVPQPHSNRQILGWKWIAAFAAASVLLTLTKNAYMPLAALILIVPGRRLGGGRKYWLVVAGIAAANLAALIIWTAQTRGLDTIINTLEPHVSARGQLAFLRHHPSAIWTIASLTAQWCAWPVLRSFVGTLGWFNVLLSPIFVVIYLIALLLACCRRADDAPRTPRWRLAIVIPPLATICGLAIVLLNYMYWNRVGWPLVVGLQGRYFIPLAPALLVLAWGLWPSRATRWLASRPAWQLDAAAAFVAVGGCFYALIVVYIHDYVSILFAMG